MKSLILNFANCIYEKNFANGLKEKILLSTKMEKLCKKNIINKIHKSANFTDLPFKDKIEVSEIQLFGAKISRLYSQFVLVGDENIISGTKSVFSFKKDVKNDVDDKTGQIKFDTVSSNNVDKLKLILEESDLTKTFFNFVLIDESDIATLSLFSLTVSKLKEVMKSEFFVNIVVTTQENNAVWKYSTENKINTLKFPKDINEKYCSLSPVGLFPMAVLGLDLEKVLRGAKQILEDFKQEDAKKSLSFATALINYNFYKLKKRKVVLISKDKSLHNFVKHFENLLQDFNFEYSENIFMFLNTSKKKTNIKIPKLNDSIVLPKTFQELENIVYFATKQNLQKNQIPNYSLEIFDKTDETIGQLLFFFELTSVIMQELFGIKSSDNFDIVSKEQIRLTLASPKKLKEKEKENFEIKI